MRDGNKVFWTSQTDATGYKGSLECLADDMAGYAGPKLGFGQIDQVNYFRFEIPTPLASLYRL